MKFSIKGFSSKCDQIRRNLRICQHLLEKSLMENFIFCAVPVLSDALMKKKHLHQIIRSHTTSNEKIPMMQLHAINTTLSNLYPKHFILSINNQLCSCIK